MSIRKLKRLPVIVAVALGVAACDAYVPRAESDVVPESTPRPGSDRSDAMKIRITVQRRTLTATLADNPTARDFVGLLPLTLTMKDLFGREKYCSLPRVLAEGGERRYDYEVGQLIYWSAGPDVAIYYRQDGERIPEPGIIVLGTVDSGVDALDLRGGVTVRFERMTDDKDERATPVPTPTGSGR